MKKTPTPSSLLFVEGGQLVLEIFDDGSPRFRRFYFRDFNPLSGQFKKRLIYAPNKKMRLVHKQLIRQMRYHVQVDMTSATACQQGSSPVRHILPHRHNRYFYVTDLHNAYGMVDGERLARIIAENSNGLTSFEAALEFLKLYCLAPEGGLATGAPASPILFNIYAAVLIDAPMRDLCEKFGLSYTRYLDDIVISSPNVPFGQKKRQQILSIIREAGFDISYKKTKVLDLQKGRITLCGFGLEIGGRIFLPRRYRQKLKGMLHAAVNLGRRVSPAQIAGHYGLFNMSMVNGQILSASEAKILSLRAAYRYQRESAKHSQVEEKRTFARRFGRKNKTKR